MNRALRCLAVVLVLGIISEARAANITYQFVNYAADQNGATISGYFTLRPEPNNTDLSMSDVLDWSITISQGGTSYSTGKNDSSAMLNVLGQIKRTATELTIAPGLGWLWIESDTIDLSYNRNPDQYSGAAGSSIAWSSTSLDGTEPWVIARALASPAVPEPSSFILLGTACLGLGWRMKNRAASKSAE